MKHQPTNSQWEAVRETERHLLVAAGAGSGKTQTVVAKILYLLGEPVRKERIAMPLHLADIAAITYTTRAAADLKSKLREELRGCGRRREAYELDTARIGTIHSFCGEILREFALRTGRPPFGPVLGEGESAALAGEIVRDTLIDALETNAIPELATLLGVHSISRVESWIHGLVTESDRLRAIASRRDTLPPPERAVVDLALRALTTLEERLVASAQLDFDRMITWTRDLIRDHKGVRRSLQRRIRVLIIDEFQDVDPAQREIAYLLGEPESRRKDGCRLVLVGDPKQSIYRFRRADVRVWRQVEADFRERDLGSVVTLEESWRSTPAILGLVDNTVGALLDTPLAADGTRCEDEIPYIPLRAARTDGAAAPEPQVELLVVPAKAHGRAHKAGDVRGAEAVAVAQRARELGDAGIAWSEMAILLCSWSDVDVYRRALADADIPFYCARRDGFYSRRETMDLIVALEAIRDPHDDRTLVGFLRSPFVGVNDESLLRVAVGAGRPFWPRLRETASAGELEPELARGVMLLERFVLLRDRVPTGELLRLLLEESGYLGCLALLYDDDGQAIANVRQFIRMADGARSLGVGELLRVIRDARAREDRVSDAPLRAEGENVVTITSVHSAKGLDWRVVFWCDLYRARVRETSASFLRGRDTIAVKDPDAEAQSDAWTALQEQLDLEDRAEQRRLWYVAATRAKDLLILSGIPLGKPHSSTAEYPGLMLAACLGGISHGASEVEYVDRDGVAYTAAVRWCPVDPATSDTESDDIECAGAGAPPTTAVAPRPIENPSTLPQPLTPIAARLGPDRHSATEFLTWSRCGRKHWFKYVLGLREPEVNREGSGFIDALARGLIVHDVLEHLREESDLDTLLETAIGRWDDDAPPPEGARGLRYREHLREEVALVADHPDYRAITALPTARREVGFVSIDESGRAVQGKIDLAARDEDGLVLLDVKTNQDGGDGIEAKAEMYAIQRSAYVAAAESITGSPVARFAFQFSRAGRQVLRVVDDALRAEGRRQLAGILDRIGVGQPDLTSAPVECEHCGYRRVGWCAGAGTMSSLGAASPASATPDTRETVRR